MDAVTYPQAALKDLAEKFTCVRVKYDDAPDLVKQYGVGPLPDLRFLDADGKQISKLVGFVPAARLAAEAQKALDVFSGARPATATQPASSVQLVEATPERVAAATRRAVAFLRGARRKGFDAAASGFAPDDLVLFALVSTGLDASDPDVAALCEAATSTPPVGTYQAAFRALALARLRRPEDRPAVEACAKFLAESQLANGQWTYSRAVPDKTRVLGDNSNTAYAVLGLAACRSAGIDVPKDVFARATSWWRTSVNADGGWGYRTDREKDSYASMTESGASSLLLCGAGGKDAVLDGALAWVGAHFAVAENAKSAYQQGRLLYHLYALERLGTLSQAAKFGAHDWYAGSAGYLLATQQDDGSWDDGAATPVPNTCFALLLLTRSSAFLR
jgi:hypothetical protein